jgi:uncharacterized protein with PQ loop repeat
MSAITAVLPVLAAGFAIPQFIPQLVKLARTGDTAGLSPLWSALTSVNNAAWFVYFASSGFWFALLPSSSASLLAGALTAMMVRRGAPARRGIGLAGSWMALLAVVHLGAGRDALGVVLTAAFIVQVAPSLWAAYTTPNPTGISRATWWLVLGELTCWAMFGLHERDAPLTVLGISGILSAVLMLHRARSTARAPSARTTVGNRPRS